MEDKRQTIDILFIYCTVILIGWFVSSTISYNKKIESLNTELLQAKTIVVEMYNNHNNDMEMLQSMNSYADLLEEKLRAYNYLEQFKKELDRSTEK